MCIVIIRRSHKELNRVGLCCVSQILLLFDIFSDCCSNSLIVKGCIIGNGISIHQQTVICDDRNSCILCLFLNIDKCGRIDGCDNQTVYTACDHVLDLGNLCLYIVLCVLKVYLISKILQLCFHVGTIVDPSLG